MSWIFAAVALATTGLVVLGFLGVRVLLAARELGREVDRTRRRLEPAHTLFRGQVGTIRVPKG
ncbi:MULTISPECIES: hypothetical protein [Streptosporangium]|uniref:Secreted protein n=1 Tax=Streptosporangium roseum (strain ATCC 12428 / DSM 43021 / JCM 3005 / KCTC 9067 / NCIMB 10171 / NRRL 2505 / NI 9100) TaxID=479432 RepID=D2ATU0_STRRD|nr:hypothetical protein [Streptosporangium roseum]ACZ88595.1 hypothetical protein Sros_5860 [Streptosporangium roseum DSM 43021]